MVPAFDAGVCKVILYFAMTWTMGVFIALGVANFLVDDGWDYKPAVAVGQLYWIFAPVTIPISVLWLVGWGLVESYKCFAALVWVYKKWRSERGNKH